MSEKVRKSPMKTANKEKALSALLESATITDAAKKCELSEKTLRRYLEEKEFSDEYAEARRQVVESAVTGLQNAANEAVETLRRNLNCDNPQAEIRAAQLILDNVFGNSENSKPHGDKQIVISFNFNNQLRLTNDKN
jgi:bacillopeptidase F (M6 metalloprotease family)